MALGEEIEKKSQPTNRPAGPPTPPNPISLFPLSPRAPSQPRRPAAASTALTPPRTHPSPPRPSRGPLGGGASKPCPARRRFAPLWPAVGHRIRWQDEADPWRTSAAAAAAAEASGGRMRCL
ncbi:protein VASP homolog isoform X2 [Sorghum bicolor]|uniref:protein VASP homolog isoform X2 n=1 Tax=Sorghum bicolor TaxID=4558 RepID=UPI000B425B6A|nr:protein VASP homolog isoform X2 [Sorghum bicolor]|eukprot:XP_021307640.1 protein VASP homolog isoform X2 [Sorghum bicolor]